MTEEDGENLQKQIDEIEALSSIYGEEWCVIDEAARIFCIQISDPVNTTKCTLCLQCSLVTKRGPCRAGKLLGRHLCCPGESILYQWVEKIRELLVEKSWSVDSDGTTQKTTEEVDVNFEDELAAYQPLQEITSPSAFLIFEHPEDEELPPVSHGEPITERRSTFQAHLAPVVSPKQVKMVLNKLCENKKIASATHNIYAYRIYCEDKQTFLQDCEDDGETAAGGRLLHLMQILDARNVMVVVSRWYGGILLGPDRFKHINNCARTLLVEHQFANFGEEFSKQHGKSKKVKKDSKKRSEH
ncbi:protein IMPACT isoform X2 [Ambystoma mexicanum]|uniref:protein IMPACT isoform X2 n=1 Tax=Ambystoma mexicanum TaxID=8296 RepID=UPI0037E71EE9